MLNRPLFLSIFLVSLLSNFTSVRAQSGKLSSELTKTAIKDSVATNNQKSKSPTAAMLRSLALPGWGQFYNEQIIKGLVVVAGQATLIGFNFYYNNQANQFRVGSPERDFYQDRRNLTYWLMVAATLLSMADAYIDAHLYDFDTGPDLEMRIGTLNQRANRPITLAISIQAKF